MDKIFKKRFENFEKKAPDHILDNILSEVAAGASIAPVSNNALYYKLSIYTFLALATIVSSILLWPESNTNITNDQVLLAELPIQSTNIEVENDIIEASHNTLELDEKEDVLIEQAALSTTTPAKIKESQSINKKMVLKKDCLEIKSEDLAIQDPKLAVNENPIKILAPRSTCSSECLIELKHEHTGTWKADKNIFIKNPNQSKTLIRYNKTGKVLLTYICGNVQDTFSVYFYEPSQITYQLTAQACGEQNGKVEFELPKNRIFASSNHMILNENTFENLIIDNYDIELKDNLGCEYHYNIDLPIENLIGNISYDALEQRVGYPIYFDSDIDLDEADYIWNFGDGQVSYERKPEHQYDKPGTYDISLQIIKENCHETMMLEALVIQDKKIKIPNIFTPNADGENDLFFVSVPENIHEFEACILDHSGHLVYKWTDPKMGWDGMIMNGQKAEQGTYFYIIKGKDSSRKNFEYKSFLELRR